MPVRGRQHISEVTSKWVELPCLSLVRAFAVIFRARLSNQNNPDTFDLIVPAKSLPHIRPHPQVPEVRTPYLGGLDSADHTPVVAPSPWERALTEGRACFSVSAVRAQMTRLTVVIFKLNTLVFENRGGSGPRGPPSGSRVRVSVTLTPMTLGWGPQAASVDTWRVRGALGQRRRAHGIPASPRPSGLRSPLHEGRLGGFCFTQSGEN